MSFLDSLNNILGGYASNTSTNVNVGQVNEITPEQLRKRRNAQLIVSLIVVTVVIASIIYFSKSKTK
jgi:subtilase family serine protease